MKRDAIISLCIALPVANLPFWQWRSPGRDASDDRAVLAGDVCGRGRDGV